MNITNRYPQDPMPWEQLRELGLLWLINAEVFHPRGYALAFHRDEAGEAIGFSIMGDGSEVIGFELDRDKWPAGEHPDDALARVKEILL